MNALGATQPRSFQEPMHLCYYLGYPNDPGWPAGDPSLLRHSLASHRLRSWLPAQALAERSHTIQVVVQPEELIASASAFRSPMLIIGKLYHSDPHKTQSILAEATALISAAEAKHIPVVVDFTDDLVARNDHRSRSTLQLLLHADTVVCASQALAARVSLYTGDDTRPKVIADPVEGKRQAPHVGMQAGEPIRLLWFGHSSNLDALIDWLQRLDALAREVPLQLEILTLLPAETLFELQIGLLGAALEIPITFSEWEGQFSVFDALARSHVVLLPVDTTGPKAAASNNRLTEALWGGCFVVASPLASYADFSDTAWLGGDLIAGLRWFLDHQVEAAARIERAQELIAHAYSLEAIVDHWEDLLLACESSAAIAGETGNGGLHGPTLNLGCGNHPLPGYLNIDAVAERAGVSPDIACDIRQLTLLPDDYAGEILAVHVVEHFWRWEIEAILREWIRVLKPGGRLILECPNLLSACEALLSDPDLAAAPGPEERRWMWVFYGDPGWQDPLMCHKWGYTPQSLIALLSQVGLDQARQEPAQFKLREPRDMRITALKPSAPHPSLAQFSLLPDKTFSPLASNDS